MLTDAFPKLGCWTIVAASTRSAVARCRCGNVRTISTENPPASCGCSATARNRKRELRAGGRYRNRNHGEAP